MRGRHSTWTLFLWWCTSSEPTAVAHGNGFWVFCCSWEGVAEEGVKKDGRGESKETMTERSTQANGHPLPSLFSCALTVACSFIFLTLQELQQPPALCIQTTGLFLLPPLLTPDSEISPSPQKAFPVTFSIAQHTMCDPCHHPVLSECHRQFPALGTWKRGAKRKGKLAQIKKPCRAADTKMTRDRLPPAGSDLG